MNAPFHGSTMKNAARLRSEDQIDCRQVAYPCYTPDTSPKERACRLWGGRQMKGLLGNYDIWSSLCYNSFIFIEVLVHVILADVMPLWCKSKTHLEDHIVLDLSRYQPFFIIAPVVRISAVLFSITFFNKVTLSASYF